MTKSRKRFPKTVLEFVRNQTAIPEAEICKDDSDEPSSVYSSYWYKAITCMLLSGPVKAKADGYPNRTDVNRICKEANFNQYLFERVAKFLIAAEVIKPDRQGRYGKGPNATDFWDHGPEELRAVTRCAVLRLVEEQTGYLPWRPTMVWHAGLIEFLTLFWGCFRGLTLPESQVGRAWQEFANLPQEDLDAVADNLGVKIDSLSTSGWKYWLDEKGQKALVAALYEAEWAWYAEHDKTGWFLASPLGLAMLGLASTPAAPELPVLFKALPNLCILAGARLPLDKLVPLFRHCTIKRIDQVFEFQLDPQRLAAAPARTAPGKELRQVLGELEPLPPTISSMLETKSKVCGEVRIRWCSALVKPENTEVLAAIREHPQLKGYLEPGAPSGHLLIKSRSNPDNFVRRCQALGFTVTSL